MNRTAYVNQTVPMHQTVPAHRTAYVNPLSARGDAQ